MATGWGSKTWGEESWGDLNDVTLSVSGLSTTINVLGQNLATYSKDFTNGAWFKGATSATKNVGLAPDGTNTANLVAETTATNNHYWTWGGVFPGNNIAGTFSVYFKKGTGANAPDWIQISSGGGQIIYANFNLTTGAVGNYNTPTAPTMIDVGNGWYRCIAPVNGRPNETSIIFAFTNNVNTTQRYNPSTYAGQTDADVLAWGAQVEQNSISNFKPTESATVSSSLTLQANADVSVTGSQLTSTNAGITAGISVDPFTVTGSSATISIGNESIALGIQQDVTGSSVSSSVGTATVDENYLIGSGWGRDAWGTMVWGDAYTVQTGSVSATTSVGAIASITADANVTPTGQVITASPGQLAMTGDANVTVSGVSATTSVGTVQALNVVGSSLQTHIQAVDIEAGGNVTLNVIEHTANVSVGEPEIHIAFEIFLDASLLANTSVGSVTTQANADVSVTGISLTSTVGDETIDLNTPVDVTGVSLTASIGDESIQANADVPVTGISATTSVGSVSQVTTYSVSGVAMTMAIGEEIPTANANVTVTGVQLTNSIGSVNITSWSEIDPGVNNVWTPVDLAA